MAIFRRNPLKTVNRNTFADIKYKNDIFRFRMPYSIYPMQLNDEPFGKVHIVAGSWIIKFIHKHTTCLDVGLYPIKHYFQFKRFYDVSPIVKFYDGFAFDSNLIRRISPDTLNKFAAKVDEISPSQSTILFHKYLKQCKNSNDNSAIFKNTTIKQLMDIEHTISKKIETIGDSIEENDV